MVAATNGFTNGNTNDHVDDHVKRSAKYASGLQRVPSDAPIEDIIALLKRDGGVIVKSLVPTESIDQAYKEIKPKMDTDKEWEGKFFPSSSPHAVPPSP